MNAAAYAASRRAYFNGGCSMLAIGVALADRKQDPQRFSYVVLNVGRVFGKVLSRKRRR